MEWFPDEPNGLNRYFFDLLRALREYERLDARAIVLGPAKGRPAHVTTGPEAGDSLPTRLWRYATAVGAEAPHADVIDGHFALYSAASLLARGARRPPFVVHFQGPWADESRVAGVESALRVTAKRIV